MIMCKALGIPTVASPVPSYVATLTHGCSCYFARNVEEWIRCLAALADRDHRRKIGLADRERIVATYGREVIGNRWLAVFEELAGRRPAGQAAAERRGRGG
jgi:glycosyltransferase involved in cell wall biosynthesis